MRNRYGKKTTPNIDEEIANQVVNTLQSKYQRAREGKVVDQYQSMKQLPYSLDKMKVDGSLVESNADENNLNRVDFGHGTNHV